MNNYNYFDNISDELKNYYVNTKEMLRLDSISCGTYYSKMFDILWYSSLEHINESKRRNRIDKKLQNKKYICSNFRL